MHYTKDIQTITRKNIKEKSQLSPHLHFLLVVINLPGNMDMHGAPLPWFLKVPDKNTVLQLHSSTRMKAGSTATSLGIKRLIV